LSPVSKEEAREIARLKKKIERQALEANAYDPKRQSTDDLERVIHKSTQPSTD